MSNKNKELFILTMLLVSVLFDCTKVYSLAGYSEKTGQAGIDTVGRINFSFDSNFDEPGWTSVYGSGSFPVDLGNGVSVLVSGGTLSAGASGEPTTVFPAKVGGTNNFISNTSNNPVEFTINGLDPSRKYSFELFCSRKDDAIPGEAGATAFFVKDNSDPNKGEFLIIDDTFTYSDKMNGFKYWRISDIENSPADWTSPYNYEYGEIYTRYEVISQATNRPSYFQFGFWQDGKYANLNERETFGGVTKLNGPGSFAIAHSSPSVWWELNPSKPLDFSRPNDISCFGIPLRAESGKIIAQIPGTDFNWGERIDYHPMTIRATAVAVARGSVFSGWERWVGKTLSINSVGNTDSVLVLADIAPSPNGKLVIRMSKPDGQYGYINALIIKKAIITGVSLMDKGVIKCYPSPVKDKLTLTNLQEQSHIEIYDIRGSKIIETENSEDNSMQINMSALKAGCYMVKVSNSSSSENIKIIK